MKLFVAMACIAMFIVVASAESFDAEKNPDIPPLHEYDDGQCYTYQMKMLYAATQIGDPNQESYLRAADAYRQLEEAGQRCL